MQIVAIQGDGELSTSPKNGFKELRDAFRVELPELTFITRAWRDRTALYIHEPVLLVPFSHGIEAALWICESNPQADIHIAGVDSVLRKYWGKFWRPRVKLPMNVISARSWTRVCGIIPPFSSKFETDPIPDEQQEKARSIFNFPSMPWTGHTKVMEKAITEIVNYARWIFG